MDVPQLINDGEIRSGSRYLFSSIPFPLSEGGKPCLIGAPFKIFRFWKIS